MPTEAVLPSSSAENFSLDGSRLGIGIGVHGC